MRFRAKLVDIGCIQHFTRVVATISKLAKNCILRITTNKLYFILSERVVNGSVSIWCELVQILAEVNVIIALQSHFFNEYAMDGVSEENNEIFLELTPENLLRCLKSAQSAKSIKMKLTKKHTPCLTFEVELASLAVRSRVVVHDVPVSVIPRRLWDDYEEPDMPDFDVSIYMPPLKLLKNVVERMKALSNFVTLSANGNGEMKLKVETDLATVVTHFRELEIPTWSKAGEQESQQEPSHQKNRDPATFAEARIDIRKLAQFLIGQQVNPTRVLCNIVDEEVAHFFLLHEDLSLQYFMPVVSG